MYTAIGVKCPHCGTTGMIQHDTRYTYTRCVACGREWNWQTGQTIYPVVGSESALKKVDRDCVIEEKGRIRAMFPDQGGNLPPGTRRCDRCGRTFEIAGEAVMCGRCERITKGSYVPKEPRYVTHNFLRWQNMAALMKSKRLTRARVAFLLGCAPSTVSWYVWGKSAPEPDVARKLCEILGLDFETHYRQVKLLIKGKDWSKRPKIVWDDVSHDEEHPTESQERAVG